LIDVQGFFDNYNIFILKEIGIVFEKVPNLNKSFLIEPPYDFTFLNTKSRKTAIWLTNTHHQIFWNDGENSFPQTRKYLRTITSGKQKMISPDVFDNCQLNNIGEMGRPPLNRFKGNRFPYCDTYLKSGVCTLNNAYIILLLCHFAICICRILNYGSQCKIIKSNACTKWQFSSLHSNGCLLVRFVPSIR